MPDMDGLELLASMRGAEETATLPALILTARHIEFGASGRQGLSLALRPGHGREWPACGGAPLTNRGSRHS